MSSCLNLGAATTWSPPHDSGGCQRNERLESEAFSTLRLDPLASILPEEIKEAEVPRRVVTQGRRQRGPHASAMGIRYDGTFDHLHLLRPPREPHLSSTLIRRPLISADVLTRSATRTGRKGAPNFGISPHKN